MALELTLHPEVVLHQVAAPIARIGPEHPVIAREMFEIMYRNHGIGLAAPQAGLPLRLVVANLAAERDRRDEEMVFVNPEILDREGELRAEEGCLSAPGISVRVLRAQRVTFRYATIEGEERIETVEDLFARMVQHEIDHLNGIIILDKMSEAEREFSAAALAELEDKYRRKRASRRPGTPSQ